MAGSDDKKALEYYLRYIASQNNKKLSGKCDRGEHANIFYRLVERFCVGRHSSSSILDSIYSFIGKETFGKDIRPYAFFDIDTLIAYNEYLNKVRLYSNDGVYIERAIDLAMKDMLSYSIPSRENGFYDKGKPVVLRRDDEGKVKPLRRLPTKSFESRYDIADCQQMLNEYIKEKELDMQERVQDNQFEENQSGIIEEQPELPSVGSEVVSKTSHKSRREKAYIDGDFFIFRGEKYKKTNYGHFVGIASDKLPLYILEGTSLADGHKISLKINVHHEVYEGMVFKLGQGSDIDAFFSKCVGDGYSIDD